MKTIRSNLEIDLHRQSLNGAMSTVAQVLDDHKTDTSTIIFITGKGLHSKNHKPVIKPELEAYLERNGYWWSFPHTKNGKQNTGSYGISTFAELLE